MRTMTAKERKVVNASVHPKPTTIVQIFRNITSQTHHQANLYSISI